VIAGGASLRAVNPTDHAHSAVNELSLTPPAPPGRIPEHLGVILDGNRRWAQRHGVESVTAYRRSAGKVESLLGWCEEAGVRFVTIWVLSPDNLQRGQDDVRKLLDVIIFGLQQMAASRRWRFRFIGDLRMLPQHHTAAAQAIEESTAEVRGMVVNVALAYGGRKDIATAVQRLLAESAASGVPDWAGDLTAVERQLNTRMSTAGQPDPDLVIRTSGEQRTSGFLLWQTAQSELYFTTTAWPDFTEADLQEAFHAYGHRIRRFGH
jgi:short-chain Z-isoprenyl diphosphate synthase